MKSTVKYQDNEIVFTEVEVGLDDPKGTKHMDATGWWGFWAASGVLGRTGG